MKRKIGTLILLTTFLLASSCSTGYGAERKIWSRNLTGLDVEVYAPYQCYPGETITVRVRIEALEAVTNASITMFILSSKSEGYIPWTFSFTILNRVNLSSDAIQDETHDVLIPSDVSPGLTYGKVILQWSVYHQSSWVEHFHEDIFRVTYVKNYEDLQTAYDSVLRKLQNTTILMYVFLATTTTLAASTAYFAKRKPKGKRKCTNSSPK